MATPACNPDRLTLQRIGARTFVVLGGLFWVVAALAAGRGFIGGDSLISANNALLPLVLTVAVFAIGWYFEYVASVILVAGSAAMIAWGLASGWEPGVWGLMISTLLAPMAISATLFFLAARMETACRLEARPAEVPAA